MQGIAAGRRRQFTVVPQVADRQRRQNVVALEPAREITFARGDTVFFDGDAAEFYFEILSGTVRCCRLTPDGRRQIYRFAGAGKVVGLAAGDTYAYSAEALTDVVVRRHRVAGLDAAMVADSGFQSRLLRALREELAASQSQMMLLGRMSAGERIAAFLLELAGPDGTGSCIDLPMTRSDIADYLGLTIETVSRKLNELRAGGLLKFETATRIRIVDLKRMGALAEAA